jgi:hypothetical protein
MDKKKLEQFEIASNELLAASLKNKDSIFIMITIDGKTDIAIKGRCPVIVASFIHHAKNDKNLYEALKMAVEFIDQNGKKEAK